MGNKFKTSLNRKLNLGYCLVQKVVNFQKKESKKNLIVLHDKGFGDVICALDALKKLSKLYPLSEGHLVYIATSAKMYNFLLELNCTYDYEFIILDLENDSCEKFSVFKENFKKLNAHSWNDCLVFNRIGKNLRLLLASLSIKHSYRVESRDNLEKENYLTKIISSLIPNCKMIPIRSNLLMFDLFTVLLQAVKPELNLKVGVGWIPVLKTNLVLKKGYCIVSSGLGAKHNHLYRAWPLERFAKVIDYITTNLGLKVYLCGSCDDEKANRKVYELVENKKEVIDLTGKTSIKEWVEITRGAEFVFGNDSGYIHLATAVNTQAFVLLGFWNYGKFFPYPKTKGSNKRPILITSNEPKCSSCDRVHFWDSKNKAAFKFYKLCKENIVKKKVYNCIDAISSFDVICVLENYYKKNL